MHEHHRKRQAALLLTGLCALLTRTAAAQPYELIAIYEPIVGTSTSKAIRLNLTENGLLPDGGESHVLDRIVVRFEPDGVSLSAASIFSRLRFTVEVGTQQTTSVIRTEDIGKLPNREHTLVRWRGDDQPDAVVAVKVSLQAIYSSDFLCMQERALFHHAKAGQVVERIERPLQSDALWSSPLKKAAQKELEEAPSLLTPGRVPILFSYCKTTQGTNTNTLIDWSAAHAWPPSAPKAAKTSPKAGKGTLPSGPLRPTTFQLGDPDKVKNADRLREAHKRALSDGIVEQLNDRFSSFGRTVATDTDEPSFDNVLVQVASSFKLSVIKSAGSLMLIEESGGEVQRLADLIDQDADVSLSLDRPTCLQLPPAALMNTPWVFELEVPDGKDGKTRRAKIDLDFRHGCNRMLMVPWKDFLNQRVTFRVIYRVLGSEDLIVFKDAFWVYNLGLITTLPVVTEIVSAAQKASPADVEATSSIPVSFAIPVNDKERRAGTVAITFPFTLSLNTRNFPNLADYVALAPSVSIIGGGSTPARGGEEPPPTGEAKDQGPNARIGLGVGVSLFRAFHFGYAWAPADGGRYVLVGISVPELLPLFKQAL